MKTKKLLSILTVLAILLTIIFTLTTCKKKGEDTPPANDEFVIAPKAKFIVDNDWQSMIKSIDSSNYTLTFDTGVLSKYSLAQGDLLVSTVGNGLLRKIEITTQSANNVIIQTSQATLVDLIQQGTIDFKGSLSLSRIKSINYYYPGISLDTVSIKSTDGTLFNWNINTEIAPLIRLQGNFQYTSDFIFQIDITILEGLKKVNFGFEGTENFNLALVAGKQFNFSKEITLETVYFTPFVILLGIPPFAIVVAPVLDIKLGLNGYANANITTTLSQNFSIKTGLQYLKSSGWSSYLDTVKSFNYTPPQLNMNAGAVAYIKPELRMLIFNLVGPYVNGKGYGRIAADLTQTPWWKMYYGFKMGAGVKATILGKVLFDYSKDDLLIWEQLVGQSTGTPPTVTTTGVTNIKETTATCGGNITSQGSSPVTARGVCWSTSSNPTTSDAHTNNGSGTGAFTSNLTGLTKSTPYYVRAYATNSTGPGYGSQVSFTTTGGGAYSIAILSGNNQTGTFGEPLAEPIKVTVNNITGNPFPGAKVNFAANNGGSVSPSQVTTGADGIASATWTLGDTDLSQTTTVTAFKSDNTTPLQGSPITFIASTSGTIPTVSTSSITNITGTSATGGGDVTEEGSSPVTIRGVCWSTSEDPTTSDAHTTDGSGTGSFTSDIAGLTANTPYYVRAYATNSTGPGYGDQVSFTTTGGSGGQPCPGMPTITDSRDGKIYPTVQIGSQCWLQKNMNYQTDSSWCYNNDPAICTTYGRLYNWESALGACPSGWHLPGDAEWTALTDFLGGESIAGGKMKEAGPAYWSQPNAGATNSSGFTALPDGFRDSSGLFGYITDGAYFWSSSGYSSTHAWFRYLLYNYQDLGRYDKNKTYGFSARCVKD